MNKAKTRLIAEDREDGEFGVIDLLLVLAKFRKGITLWVMGVAIATCIISRLMPDIYVATAKLLPPQQSQANSTVLMATLGVALGVNNSLPYFKNKGDLYVGLLRTRSVADALIAKFDLRKVYGVHTITAARRSLAANTSVIAGKDGTIAITVEDESGMVAMHLANGYIAELDRLLRTAAILDARQRRQFFAAQLATVTPNTISTEMKLKQSLDTHGLSSVSDATLANIANAAQLSKQIAEKKIQLESIRAFVTANEQSYARPLSELRSLEEQLVKLQSGSKDNETAEPAAGAVSGNENVNIMRDLKYTQMLIALLQNQYELARLDEVEGAAPVQVLDAALYPEEPTQPQRGMLVALSSIAALILAIACAFVAEAKHRHSQHIYGKDWAANVA